MHEHQPATQAVAQLARQYTAPLYRYRLAMLQNEHDAQDAVQEAFLRYMKYTPTFETEGSERAWFFTVTANICRNMMRSRRLHPQITLDEVPEAAAPEKEATAVLDRLFDLPPKCKTVMLLHYMEGYKVNEIAKMLRLTASAVKMRLQKGRKLLKEEIEEDDL